MKSVIFSFFSGSGFLDLGFEKAGFDIVFVNEINDSFIKAYEYSRTALGHSKPKYGYHLNSIDDYLNGAEDDFLHKCIGEEKSENKLVGFVGGPPCPDFSVGGKNKGKDGDNGRLSLSYVECIKKYNPDWFVFENVKGLWRTKKHREFYDNLKKQLEISGYILNDRLINSIEFGVAQDRDRIILFGVREKLCKNQSFEWEKYMVYPGRIAFNFKWPDKNKFNQKISSSKDVPENLTVDFWFKKNDVTKHPNAKHYFKPRAGLAKFLTIEEGDTSKKSYKRLHRYRYSPTAAYGNNEVHLHPCEPRRLSAAEALAIQSLPKNFELPPTMTLSAMFKTIGNGVPFLFAFGVAKTVKDYLGVDNEID